MFLDWIQEIEEEVVMLGPELVITDERKKATASAVAFFFKRELGGLTLPHLLTQI